MLSKFLHEYREAGDFDSEGDFTINPSEVWGKLQEAVNFRAGAFVLKIVQGLVGLGASSVSCEINFSDITVSAQGCEHPPEGLLIRFQSPVGTVKDATDDLAVGVLASFTQEVERVRWAISGGESVVMQSEGMERSPDKCPRGSSEFRFEFSSRLTIKQLQAVNETVSELCQYSPAPLRAHVPLLPGHFAKPRSFGSSRYRYLARMPVFGTAERDGHRPPMSGEALHTFGAVDPTGPSSNDGLDCLFYTEASLTGIESQAAVASHEKRLLSTVFFVDDPGREVGRILLIHRGVVVHDEERDIGPPNSVVLSNCRGLDFDASTLRIVENQKYQDRLEEIRVQTRYLRKAMQENWPED